VDENSRLILKDFNMEIDFAGRLKWYGKQVRLEIYYDESRYIVQGERKSVKIESPKGDKIASIDIGINVLARAKQDHFHFMRQVSQLRSMADKAKNLGEYECIRNCRKRCFTEWAFCDLSGLPFQHRPG